jgi:hypothetical protein
MKAAELAAFCLSADSLFLITDGIP